MMSRIIEMTYANGCREGSHSYGDSMESYQQMIRDANRAAESGQIGRISGISISELEQGAGGYAHLTERARKLFDF